MGEAFGYSAAEAWPSDVQSWGSRPDLASALLRYRDPAGDELVDIIDSITMEPDARLRVFRMLAEIDAEG